MKEYDLVVLELKNSEEQLNNQMEQLKCVNQELEQIQLVINYIMDLVLSSKRLSDISLILDRIKEKLNFSNDDLEFFVENLPNDSKDALWKILSIVQDLYADKETEKIDVEEEIKRIRIEINDILEVLKTDNERKRER